MTTIAVRTASAAAIRRLRRHELAQVFELCQRCFDIAYTWDHLEAYRSRARDGFMVATDGDDMIAVVVAISMRLPWLFGRAGEIALLGVDPRHRGRGLGRRLLETAFVYLRSHGMREARLHVDVSNSAAIALYESAGMYTSHVVKGYYRSGNHALRMVGKL